MTISTQIAFCMNIEKCFIIAGLIETITSRWYASALLKLTLLTPLTTPNNRNSFFIFSLTNINEHSFINTEDVKVDIILLVC